MSALLKTLTQAGIDNFVLVDVGAKGSIETINGIENICEVHAFEPHPDEYALLKKKYLSHPYKSLHLNCFGLADKPGKSEFMISNNTSMSSLLQPDLINYKKHFGNYNAYQNWASCISTSKKTEITLDTIDHYFEGKHAIDYLKLDTQGSELSILRGAEKMLKQGRIKVIKVEVSTVATYKDQPLFSDIDIYLRGFNYCLVDFLTYRENPSYLLGEDQETHFAPCGDAIYYLFSDAEAGNESIKKASIINYLGYSSLSISILENVGLDKNQIDALIYKSRNNSTGRWKKIARDVLPPILIKLFKKRIF